MQRQLRSCRPFPSSQHWAPQILASKPFGQACLLKARLQVLKSLNNNHLTSKSTMSLCWSWPPSPATLRSCFCSRNHVHRHGFHVGGQGVDLLLRRGWLKITWARSGALGPHTHTPTPEAQLNYGHQHNGIPKVMLNNADQKTLTITTS